MVDKHDDKHGAFEVFFGLSDSAQDLEDVCDYRLTTPAGLEEDTEPLDTVALQGRPVEAGEVLVQLDHAAEEACFEAWSAAPAEDADADAQAWAQPFGAFLEAAPAHETLVAPMPSVRTQGHARSHKTHVWHVATALAEQVGAEYDEAFVAGLAEVLEVSGCHGRTLVELEAVLVNQEPSPEELLFAAHVREHWSELGDSRQLLTWEVATMLVVRVNMHELDELLRFVELAFEQFSELRMVVDHHLSLHLSEHDPDELPSLYVWEFLMESLDSPNPDVWHLVGQPHRPARVHDMHRFSRRPDLHSDGLRVALGQRVW